jgi:hypothetical protein
LNLTILNWKNAHNNGSSLKLLGTKTNDTFRNNKIKIDFGIHQSCMAIHRNMTFAS